MIRRMQAQDNVYVAYDELNSNSERVAVSLGTNPPNFVRDNLSGNTGGGFVNQVTAWRWIQIMARFIASGRFVTAAATMAATTLVIV